MTVLDTPLAGTTAISADLEVRSLSGRLGAEIRGVDLRVAVVRTHPESGRATRHSVVADFGDQHRVIQRVTLRRDEPV